MSQAARIVLSLAYIFGLMMNAFPQSKYGLLVLGFVLAAVLPRFWRMGPRGWVWILAGTIAFLAAFYFQLRVPEPAENDISQFVTAADIEAEDRIVTVRGKVMSSPRLTRSELIQFELAAIELRENRRLEDGSFDPASQIPQPVTGKLYVTVPLLQGTGLHPGLEIPVTGMLYEPTPATNPGAFDFSSYLAWRGIFAGMRGQEIQWQDVRLDGNSSFWGLWKIRQRIVRAQVEGLGSPEGQLVSAMVLGRRAVDLPYEIRDRFILVGMAHALAASGFHVTLILGLVLAIAQRLSDGTKFWLGTATLVLYAGLAGFQASVLRATIMGFGGLVGLVLQRKVRPVGILLLAAVMLLLYNPLWIRDIGFQLSFAATLGLIVTVNPLVKRWDRLPVTIATALAVPISATIWTLPLQMYYFNVVCTYSIFVNAIATPLLSLITIGGFISGIAASIYPPVGSVIAGLLYYPVGGLLAIVKFFSQLPGNNIAVGTIALWQLGILYGLIGVVCLYFVWQGQEKQEGKKLESPSWVLWVLLFLFSFGVVVFPAWHTANNLFQVTVLDTRREPVLVIRDRWQVALFNSGDTNTVRYVVLPFLTSQGINRIETALAMRPQTANNSGWQTLLESLFIKRWYYPAMATESEIGSEAMLAAVRSKGGLSVPLSIDSIGQLGVASVQQLNADPFLWQLQIRGQTWLLMGSIDTEMQTQLIATGGLSKVQVLCWSGAAMSERLLEILNPKVAIAFSDSLNDETAKKLQVRQTQLFWTRRDGAIQWTPEENFQTILNTR
ncbi:ComEC/Rec2 family competence protein [Oscillatoriales cyanobacterium LEGE 11467]|uniref:ComEC/Rec2 family competence protein n=1 Tax=Zarconia navalis LEGE 11467 TaxID=1828826 RepID=A0A928Z6V0_9CYAN|nr:ComEC/Rec2 family competence protein [Zarconia navalis]MBE9040777.1 ComEC/Rec2 family competence protein [Zarconia navalis LEGE 11467]